MTAAACDTHADAAGQKRGMTLLLLLLLLYSSSSSSAAARQSDGDKTEQEVQQRYRLLSLRPHVKECIRD